VIPGEPFHGKGEDQEPSATELRMGLSKDTPRKKRGLVLIGQSPKQKKEKKRENEGVRKDISTDTKAAKHFNQERKEKKDVTNRHHARIDWTEENMQ